MNKTLLVGSIVGQGMSTLGMCGMLVLGPSFIKSLATPDIAVVINQGATAETLRQFSVLDEAPLRQGLQKALSNYIKGENAIVEIDLSSKGQPIINKTSEQKVKIGIHFTNGATAATLRQHNHLPVDLIQDALDGALKNYREGKTPMINVTLTPPAALTPAK